MDELGVLFRLIRALEEGRSAAVVTVVSTSGSTPGKVGYQMLVFPESLSEKPVVGPSPSERVEGKEVEAGDAPECIVDGDRRCHRPLQPGEARGVTRIGSKIRPTEDGRAAFSARTLHSPSSDVS